MGRQWLHSKKAVASKKKAQATGKLVREIVVAAKLGGVDPEMNPRLAQACEKARKASVSKDVIERACKKGGGGDETSLSSLMFEGYAPHKVPVIVETLTDNPNRTAPELRVLFRKGQLGAPGSNKFLFDLVGMVEAYRDAGELDLEEIAIEAGANEVETLSNSQNDDIPEDALGARFLCERGDIHAVSKWLAAHDWKIVTSEPGYISKNNCQLKEDQYEEVGAFLEDLDEHDDVHRIWAALP
ncbi:YebC/PmpR family DNA-binding transcriptional regulator [bacterium]|jgi:YebC/PmpR family DNA-binding regulatory protein|nr:YebC/PmpR family DNA-binding transcriptional regulator [Verrucomicrobiota bacterium]MDC0267916.1 YebC/PmpR family DNA-binding transcriptional regulator [bacterium]MDG1890506.1 YebC/PmpR family DNA-binding transcriptional regulator [Verrucomicrobiota bacterium]